MPRKISSTNKTKSTRTSDDFEITHRTAKTLEKRLNGIEPSPKTLAKNILGNSISRIKFRSPNQKLFMDTIDNHEITICSGPAGCGKSYLAIIKAFQLLLEPDNNYNEIIISTPAVEADEKLGFLPGDVDEKMSPYLYSTYYLMEKVIGKYALNEMVDKGLIRIAALGFLRGCNISDAIFLLEEAQNTSISMCKTILTRIESAKMIFTGDCEQNDKFKKKEETGLYFMMNYLKDVKGIGIFEFTKHDIVRNPIIEKILEKFEEQGK